MVNADAIPDALRERDCWVCWRYECRQCREVFDEDTEECADCEEEISKMPRSPNGDYRASSTDGGTWSSFEQALKYHEAEEPVTEGLGFAFDEGDMVAGFDLDDVRDPENEEVEPWARDVVARLDSYTEVSPSGTGYHTFVFGFHPGDRSKVPQESTLDAFGSSELELYDSGRYFTVTGERVGEVSHDVETRPDVTKTIYEEYMAPDEDPEPAADVDAPDLNLDDEEVIEKAKNAENGDEFERLHRGDDSAHAGDTSRADLDYCGRLAFWTGGDKSQMDRIFRNSARNRDKWDESHRSDGATYGGMTIEKALEGRSEFYNPQTAAATDGGATAAEPGGNADSGPKSLTLCPVDVATWAGLGKDEDVSDLDDRQKAASVWDLIQVTGEVYVRVRRDNGSLWAYDSGVWKPEGERVLRHAGRAGIGSMNYGQNVLSELKAQARSDPRVEVEADDFGLVPGKLAVENGLVELEAAADGAGYDALRDLEAEDYALAQLPVEYNPDAEYDEWAEYVEEWAEEGRADALQEYVGYCLHVGEMPLHRALLLVGSGANGKGTFLHVVRALLGSENTSSIELQTLANEKDAVADFYGAIANIDDDLSARKLGNGLGMFKKLVGGDRVRARRLYEDGFEFDATGKHLYAANEVPDVTVSDDDEAFWRRWLLVEFPNHYPPSERDYSLRPQLTQPEALSGVLNWAIEGWRRLLEQGHFTNEERYAHAKRDRWQAWGDSIEQFISDCVERDDDAANMTTSDAHRRYAAWCREVGEKPASQQKLTSTLKSEDVGYAQSVRVDGKVQRGYKALGLSDDVPDLEDTPERGPRPDAQQQSLTD